MMRLAYVYPEPLPDSKARAISAINTVNALSSHCNATLFYVPDNQNSILESPHTLQKIPLQKTILGIKSNKIFNYHLSKYLNKYFFDTLYVRHLKTADFLLKNKLNEKVIYECHEIFFHNNKKVEKLEKFVCEHADGLVFVNKTLQKEFNKTFDLSHVPQAIINNGCSFNLPHVEKNFTSNKELIYIGNFFPWKGIDFLIEAMNFLPYSNLKIIGGGNRKNELELTVKKMRLQNRIFFIGKKHHNEIKDILKNATFTIIPNNISHQNNFSTPIKLYEYMAASTVVIASNTPTIQEIIKDGVNGFLFETGNMESFIQTINKVMHLDKQKLQEVSYNAWKTSLDFTWDKRAEKIVTFANSLLTEKS